MIKTPLYSTDASSSQHSSCSHESAVATWWHNAIANVPRPWQPGEPTDDGGRARCSLVPCHRFLLESYDCQVQLQCHVVEWFGNVQAEAVGEGITSG